MQCNNGRNQALNCYIFDAAFTKVNEAAVRLSSYFPPIE
jgi:hypothetical protein